MLEWKYLKEDLLYKWENLKVRRWVNENPKIILGITVFSVLLTIIIVIAIALPDKHLETQQSKKLWFYDLNTEKLFVTKSTQLPPIEAPSGPLPDGSPAGVLAHVYKFSPQNPNEEHFIGYLETLPLDIKRKLPRKLTPETDDAKLWYYSRLIRTIEDSNWISFTSEQAQLILNELNNSNQGIPPAEIYPQK